MTEGRIRTNEATVATRQKVDDAAARLDSIVPQLADAEAAVVEAEATVKAQAELEKELAKEAAALRELQSAGKALKTACDELHARSALIDEVPCKGTDLQGKCNLLAEARTAKESLPGKQNDLDLKRGQRDELTAKIATLETQIKATDATAPNSALIRARAAVTSLQNERQAATATAALRSQIEAAKAQLAEDSPALERAREAAVDATSRHTEQSNELIRLDAIHQQRLAEVKANHGAEADALQKELDATPPADTAGLQAAEKKAKDAAEGVCKFEAELTTVTAKIATLQERIANYSRELEELRGDVDRAARLENEIAQWSLLSKALGNDGIIALCIDDAGPTLTTIANDLLRACYGPRFTVSIVTQRETQKGDLREDFDIRVFDADTGEDKSIGVISGGERIWINECLTRSIALYQAQASGRSYGCLFSDESDGALDPEKKRQFMGMKRKVLELGGYQREFFISHTPDLTAAADAVIDLSTLKAA